MPIISYSKTNNFRQKTKCDFCGYYTGSECMVKPSSYYCSNAVNEFNNFLSNKNITQPIKSLRRWDRR